MTSYETYGSPVDDRTQGRFDDRDDRRDTYRRRTPVDDRRRPPPRNRSRSPVIDRYQPGRDRGPREDYYDSRAPPRDRDDRRRPPSPLPVNIDRYVPGQEPEKPVIRMNPVQNPLSMDTQAGFSYFAEWWRNEQQIAEDKERAKNGGRRPSDRRDDPRQDREKERAKIQEAYDQYKQDFQVRAARSFVQQHRNEEWFKERYVPEIRNAIRKKTMEFREGAFDQWKTDMEGGTFDDFTLEGIYKQDSDGAGGMIEKEEGEAIGGAETLGVQDLVPARGGEIKDEAMNQPALLIKTLAPNVARARIEEFCKEHLGDGEAGFKWLSLSDPNPIKKFHRIGWIMINNGSQEDGDQMEDVERGEGREDGEEEEKPKPEQSTAAQKALEAINGKTIVDPIRGDFTCHVGIHNAPMQPRKKALWDLFSAPERIERDYQLARRLVTKLESDMGKDNPDDEISSGLAIIDSRVEEMRSKGELQPAPKPPKKNAFVDNDDEIKFEDGEEIEEEEEDSEELLVVKKKLDLLVEYLRRVFNFCLFCVFESDSVHELVRKCPGGHLRRPRAGLSKIAKRAAIASANGDPFPKSKEEDGPSSPVEDRKGSKFNKTEQQLLKAFNWVKTFEEKVLQLLEPEYCDLKKIGGKPVEEAVEEEMNKYVKQEDESKFRCKVPECTKLFKAEHFWKKHVEKRHEDWYNALKNDLNLVNTYVLDPSHIAPSRSDANSNGHFPLPANHQFTNGTPRGFNLQNMMSFNQNMGGPLGFVPGMPPAENGHTAGPVRRGGGRFNTRSGPYDRGNRRGFGGMPGQGRMGFIAQGGAGSGGRWGDGQGQTMNVIGPKEAVQGRAIRSYDDLDAPPVGGNAGGEKGAAAAAAAGGNDTLDY